MRTKVLVAAALALATAAAFGPALGGRFLNYDDNLYVTANPAVRSGLSGDTVKWAFTTLYAGNWHPVTWLSHALDATLHGDNPAGHHLTSLIIHVANTVLLFFLLSLVTRRLRPSAFAAALFGIHPLHVESVAWISERKDVLSAFFMLITLLAYVWYTAAPSVKRYALVGLLFAMGLMSKPMLVTLPLLLLLMDPPLGRAAAWKRLVIEKLPLLTMATASGW